MLHPDTYLAALTTLLRSAYRDRLCYVGLQGSYLRGEATEGSDIDVMVVIRNMTAADLDAYRKAIEALPDADKSCGFICGLEELHHWNPLEICQLLHTTRDHLGTLANLVPRYTDADVRAYVQLILGNLYHELCHRYVHAPTEQNISALPLTCKAVFFILQNLHYLRSRRFIGTKKELLPALTGRDRQVLELSLALGRGGAFDFGAAFSLLLDWCRETLIDL